MHTNSLTKFYLPCFFHLGLTSYNATGNIHSLKIHAQRKESTRHRSTKNVLLPRTCSTTQCNHIVNLPRDMSDHETAISFSARIRASPMQPHRHRNEFTPCESQTCAQRNKSARPRSRKNQPPTRTQNAELHNQIRSKSCHRHSTAKRTPHGKNCQVRQTAIMGDAAYQHLTAPTPLAGIRFVKHSDCSEHGHVQMTPYLIMAFPKGCALHATCLITRMRFHSQPAFELHQCNLIVAATNSRHANRRLAPSGQNPRGPEVERINSRPELKTRSFTIKFEVKAAIATVLRKGRPTERIAK